MSFVDLGIMLLALLFLAKLLYHLEVNFFHKYSMSALLGLSINQTTKFWEILGFLDPDVL